MDVISHFIAGDKFSHSGSTIDVYNPATGAAVRQVEMGTAETVNQAVEAAKRAYPAWSKTPPLKRARIMFAFKDLLEENQEQIARLISEEHGKTIEDSLGELQRGIENVEYACGAPELLKGEYTRGTGPGINAWSDHKPVGIVAGITPFNFPAMVPLWMYPLAIVCGNCFILKPSEKVPASTLFIVELLHKAGLPSGVLNLVNGGKEVVDALIEAPEVKAMSFVGSTPVAEYIYSEGTKRGKRVQALGGAKNHAIIMPDAEVSSTVNSLMGAAFGSCGERCMAISVAVCVGDEVADNLVKELTPLIQELRVGAYTQDSVDMGPVIAKEHLEKIAGYIASGVEAGSELVVDGRGLSVPDFSSGYFIGGSLFDKVTPEMKIYTDEIFGPVLCVVRVNTLEEGIQLINEHEFGNGTCIFTRDGETAEIFCDEVEAGMVGVNVPLPVPVAYHSFGGWKRSLFGDLHAYGPDGVRFYTRRKSITQKWPKPQTNEGAQFAFPSSK
ncbi:CoA-acylating methylmalonate-semialdehyde dehydrogenase [Vibrio sp. B1FLJ16]|uniref:CoA-acylating methylmalonate-semialdehyde dehydrogenase n=1 Tax=Vibrio sp. B1FLJ16 TaxID=2751178 RepID=UPI0015F525CF|nr:CoA-acylating methylmalonate-semialdehyde dehydrogenase [Vibrio sp. B1FLJ16]CAD7822533.1 Aldehyde dehydrogenase family [Vibrio sp. B1FLJ16]CAE6949326.1 Aldehyde dehydrogenase family [Vibrio sp. B1FLJ16]